MSQKYVPETKEDDEEEMTAEDLLDKVWLEQERTNSLLNELLDLSFQPAIRKQWLAIHPEDKELREDE